MNNQFKTIFENEVRAAARIAVGGHVKPDGDCVGSCFSTAGYIEEVLKAGENVKVDVFLESIPKSYMFLIDNPEIKQESEEEYDLFIALDCGDLDRLGKAGETFVRAKRKLVIDHHFTNKGYGDENYIDGDAAATCEILCSLFDLDKVSLNVARMLYLGLVHDTGVFKHSCTRRQTMEYAGMLLEKGVVSNEIIDRTFYEKTYVQNQILGRCLMESILLMDGRVIVSSVSKKVQEFYGVTSEDLEGIIDQLRITKGVEVAILVKEEKSFSHKVSMRSNRLVDVGKIAAYFGGGGHIRAAGCTIAGSVYDVINNITAQVELQL